MVLTVKTNLMCMVGCLSVVQLWKGVLEVNWVPGVDTALFICVFCEHSIKKIMCIYQASLKSSDYY